MASFAVRYRSRGQIREVRWSDGRLSAEPLVETLIDALIRAQHVVKTPSGAQSWLATLDDAEPAALTVLEALYEVGAHIIHWDGDALGTHGG
ncbi:MAG: hypothetical protein QOC92_4201 [Acidimicrobiaceae bacterium]|jgi:hypothetical protein